ncbi:MAG: lactonase family protein [Bacteroidetes bacterium]|nr:lactonase family protein [Bacteroidota bacterium]
MRLLILLLLALLSGKSFSQEYYLFVGTYTSGPSYGIYVYQFNSKNGDAKLVDSAASQNPSYLALSPTGNYLYAANEVSGSQGGEVSAFGFDKHSGKLSFLNKQPSEGTSPCYISISKDNKWLMVANYSSGTIAALPLNNDGTIAPAAQTIQFKGTGPNTMRQEKSHAHSVIFSPDGNYLLAANLGSDKEMIFKFNSASSQPLVAAKDSAVSMAPGSGPRHIAFYPHKPYVYVVEELGGTVEAFRFANGSLKRFQLISTHPKDFKGNKGSADIHISPNGKFLYASNRGDANSIAVFAIDKQTGKLKLNGIQSVLGKHPRNFIIDPTGRFLLVANKDTDNIVVFKINPQTGLLKPTGKQLQVPNPVCLKLLEK